MGVTDGITRSRLAAEFRVDRRTVNAWLADIKPSGKRGVAVLYPANEARRVCRVAKGRGDGRHAPNLWSDSKRFEQWRKLKLANDYSEGRLVYRVEVAEAVRALAGDVCGLLDDVMANELAMLVARRDDVPSARIQLKGIADRVKLRFQNLAGIWD